MKEEAGWKTLLNYGAVIMFLTMPVVVMILQLFALTYPNWLSEQLPQAEFKHLIEFQRALAILVFGLSGLRTWEVVHDHRNGKHNTHEQRTDRSRTDRSTHPGTDV